jgi:hypothetical protein
MKVAVFVDNIVDETILSSIKSFFLKQDPYSSVFLSNLHVIQSTVKDTAIINRYHLKWNHKDGIMLFLNVQDATENFRNYPMCEKQILLTKEELKNLTKDLIDNCKILIRQKNNQIRKARNAELQSIIRH